MGQWSIVISTQPWTQDAAGPHDVLLAREFMTSQVLSQPPAVFLPECRVASAPAAGPARVVPRKPLTAQMLTEYKRTAEYCLQRARAFEASAYLTELGKSQDASLNVSPPELYSWLDADTRLV